MRILLLVKTQYEKMSVTIYEVAERAGVSSSTVARILRGDVKESQARSAETARRVRRIAQEMGYRTNHRARAFSRGKTHSIGLIYTDDRWIFEGVNTQVVNSAVRQLQAEGYHMVFIPVDQSNSWEEIVCGGQIDGALTFQPLPPAVTTAMRDRRLPLVSLGDDSDASLSQVLVDDYAGAYAAVRHLIQLGHRQMLFYVHESIKPHCSVRDRQRGFEAALAEEGIDAKEVMWGPEDEAIFMLAQGSDPPTAVLCYSNLESTLLVHGMWQYGIQVPADVSLIGFNDLFHTRHMTPPLTTVAFDADRIGEVGAKLVLKSINTDFAESHPTVSTIKPKLIVRGSTGPVKK